jgi:hypothetical protein
MHNVINSLIYCAQWLRTAIFKRSTRVGAFLAWRRKQRRLPKRHASSKTIKGTKLKKKDYVSVVQSWNEDTCLCIPNLGKTRSSAISFTLRLLYPRYPLDRGLCAPQPVWSLWTSDICILTQEIEPQFPHSRRLVTMLNELARLPHLYTQPSFRLLVTFMSVDPFLARKNLRIPKGITKCAAYSYQYVRVRMTVNSTCKNCGRGAAINIPVASICS